MEDSAPIVIIVLTQRQTEFIFSFDPSDEIETTLKTELQNYFRNNLDRLSSAGIMFNKVLDHYYYTYTIKDTEDSRSFILLPHSITSSVSFYYQTEQITNELQIFLSSIDIDRFLKNKKEIKQSLKEWNENYYSQLILDFVPDMMSDIYDDKMVEFFVEFFHQHIAELFYALMMQIPVVVTKLNNKSKRQFQTHFENLLPMVSFSNKNLNGKNIPHNIYLISDDEEFDSDFENMFKIDSQTNQIEILISYPDTDIFSEEIDTALLYHADRLIPFKYSVYNNIFWNIHKIYGVLALDKGIVDFSNYLDPEKKKNIPFLNKLYRKIALIKDNVKEETSNI